MRQISTRPLIIALAITMASSLAGQASAADPPLAVYSIAKLQGEAEQWTKELKKNYPPESGEYKKAKTLYLVARASIGAWIAQVETDIRTLRDVRLSKQAQQAQAEATDSAQKLVDHLNHVFAQGIGPGAGAILTIAGKALSDTLSKIAGEYLKIRKAERNERLEDLIKQLEQLKWKPFDEI